ncbi:MAG: carboxymuconolactone decarboxylase family protein [Devosia sp.]
MRLPEIDRGDSLGNRLLISFISLVAGMRLPHAARVAFYHRDFLGVLGEWTQATMRGPSPWSVGERELMAALVAKWNSCAFCVGAHRATSARGLSQATVDAALADYHTAPLPLGLIATLSFLEKLTRTPDDVTAADAALVLQAGVTPEALTDAVAVATLFAVVTRHADALQFALPSEAEFDKAATMLLKRGYA